MAEAIEFMLMLAIGLLAVVIFAGPIVAVFWLAAA